VFGHVLLAGFGEVEDPASLFLFRSDQPLIFQELEGGIDRAWTGAPEAGTLLLDAVDQLVAMEGLLVEQEEDRSAYIPLAYPDPATTMAATMASPATVPLRTSGVTSSVLSDFPSLAARRAGTCTCVCGMSHEHISSL
jgi:hypothetical protein